MSDVAVIIVNYNAAELAIAAVESVLARVHGGRMVEVHLVDNASPDGDAAVLEKAMARPDWAGRVHFYPEEINHGFGRGNNLVLHKLAARDAPPEYVFLLNPDAQLKNEAISILADFLDTHPEAAVAGARISKPGGEAVTAAFQFPSIASEFAHALSFGPVSRLLARWRVPLSPELSTQKVDWVAGASMMARFEALASLDFFDPDFFLYYEEVELMHRVAYRGHETWYVADAEIEHVEGASTDVKSGRAERRRRPAYWYESWRMYFTKTHGRAYAFVAALAWMTGAGLNHVIAVLRRQSPAAPLRFFRDFLATGIWPLITRSSGGKSNG